MSERTSRKRHHEDNNHHRERSPKRRKEYGPLKSNRAIGPSTYDDISSGRFYSERKEVLQNSPVPSLNECEAEVLMGRVTKRISEDRNYLLFNYCRSTVRRRQWNNVNVWCHGLVFDRHIKQPVAIPYKKFFNLGQIPETSLRALKIKGKYPEQVSIKMDGCLGICFFDAYANSLRVTTPDSLDGNVALWATKWINNVNNYKKIEDYENFVKQTKKNEKIHLFEIINVETHGVVRYDFEGLVYTGSTTLEGKPEFLPDLMPEGFQITEQVEVDLIPKLFRKAKSLPITKEGYVLTWKDGSMCKIKAKKYLYEHLNKINLTVATIRNALKAGKLPDYFDRYPVEYQSSIDRICLELNNRHSRATKDMKDFINRARDSAGDDIEKLLKYAEKNIPRRPGMPTLFMEMLNKPGSAKISDLVWDVVKLNGLRVQTFEELLDVLAEN